MIILSHLLKQPISLVKRFLLTRYSIPGIPIIILFNAPIFDLSTTVQETLLYKCIILCLV